MYKDIKQDVKIRKIIKAEYIQLKFWLKAKKIKKLEKYQKPTKIVTIPHVFSQLLIFIGFNEF